MEEQHASTALDVAREVKVISEQLLRQTAAQVTSSNQRGIVAGLCEALTQATPHLRVAWTWFGPRDAHHIVPQIVAGPASDYARTLVIDEDSLTRTGPAFRALSGLRTKPYTVSESSPFEPWRRAAVVHGIRSVLALPLRSATEGDRGIFVVYADLPEYFDTVGVSLFEALADLIAALLSAASDRTVLEVAAHSDVLTGLGNRRMAGAAERTLYRSSEAAERACVLLVDLDHFKEVNDHHGHRAGDQVLREVADHLRTLVRSDDILLRWGGEEFLICISGAGIEQGRAVAEKIRAAISSARFDGGHIALTTSIGVAEIGVAMTLAAAIEAADAALYQAKRAGRDRVIVQ